MATLQQQVLALILNANSNESLSQAMDLYEQEWHGENASITKFAVLDFILWLSDADGFEEIAEIHWSHEHFLRASLNSLNSIRPNGVDIYPFKDAMQEYEVVRIINQKSQDDGDNGIEECTSESETVIATENHDNDSELEYTENKCQSMIVIKGFCRTSPLATIVRRHATLINKEVSEYADCSGMKSINPENLYAMSYVIRAAGRTLENGWQHLNLCGKTRADIPLLSKTKGAMCAVIDQTKKERLIEIKNIKISFEENLVALPLKIMVRESTENGVITWVQITSDKAKPEHFTRVISVLSSACKAT